LTEEKKEMAKEAISEANTIAITKGLLQMITTQKLVNEVT
jgi:hypothetical protein